MICFSWIKLILVLIHLKYCYCNSLYLKLFYLFHNLYQILLFPTETSSQHNPHHVLHQFSYFVFPHSTTHHQKYWIYKTICQAKPIKVIIMLYTDLCTLWVKHTPYQKSEFLTLVWERVGSNFTPLIPPVSFKGVFPISEFLVNPF